MAELAYTVREAALALGISEDTIRRMVYVNEIPHRRRGRDYPACPEVGREGGGKP